jgi:hypothetical protein
MTLEQIIAAQDKTAIDQVGAKLVKLFDRKTGTNKFGEWSIQNGILTDGHVTVNVSFRNRSEIPQDLVGQYIVITAAEKNGAKVGLRKESDQNGNPVVVADARAVIMVDAGQDDSNPDLVPSPQAQPQRQQPTAPKPAQTDAFAEARKEAARLATALIIGFDAAAYVAEQVKAKHNIQLDVEQLAKLAVHISIHLERIGATSELPTKVAK